MAALPIPATRGGVILPRAVWLFVTFLLSMMLVMSGLSGTAVADEPTADPQPSPAEKVLERPDPVSAAVTARLLKKPVEDLSKRTESTQTFANPDGSLTSKDFGEPVRVESEDGSWEDVDYTLEEQSDGSWAPKVSPVDVTVAGGSSKEVARVAFDDGQSLAVTWPENLPEPTVKGGIATYKLSETTDLIVAVTGDGVNARLRLNEQPAEDDPVFKLGLRSEGVDVSESRGGLKVVDEDGKTLGGTSTLVAWDAKTDDAGDPSDVVPLESTLNEVSTSGDVTKHDLELTTPEGYLSDPDTQYPVIIDPDISSLTRLRDTWVRQDDTTNRGADYNLYVGKVNGSSNTNAAQSYIQFDNTAIAGKYIISAELSLYQYWAYTCSDKRMNAYPIAEAWTAGITYPNRPSVLAVGDSTYVNANRGTTGCADGWTTLNITNMAKAWADGEYTNNGIRLTADDPNYSSYERRFCSSNPDTSTSVCNTATRRPNMSVTYNSVPSKPAVPTVSPSVSAGSTLWSSSPTPKVSAIVADPDGGNVRSHINVTQGSTTVYDGYSAYTASGGTVVKTLPTLADGTYTLKVWANDGLQNSATSSTAVTLKIDTAAPSAPVITCTGATTGTWYETRPAADATCAIDGSSDTATIDWTRNNKLQPTLAADGSGNASIGTLSIPANGVVGLSAKARDLAGNTSVAAEFGFGSGTAGLITPVDADRTSSTVLVEAEAPEGAALARIEQRPAGDDTATWTSATAVQTAAGSPWLGAVTDTANASSTTGKLIWDIASESGVDAPSVRDMRVCFTYSGVERCTPSRTVTVVPHAFGGSFPTQAAGPGQVALFTGEFQLDETDVEVPAYSGSLTLGRSHRTYAGASTAAAGVFGPGWVADLAGPEAGSASAEVVDNTTEDGSITLVDTDGESSTYVHQDARPAPQAVGDYLGDLDTETLNETLKISDDSGTKYLTLTEEDGTKTVWKHLGAGAWVVDHVDEPGATGTTQYTHNSGGLVTGIYAPAPSGVTCNATTQDPGCRALQLSYTTVGGEDRLDEVDLRIYNPKPTATGEPGTGAGMETITVAKYSYDTNGVLTATWDPRLGDDSAALKTEYAYQSGSGSKKLATITPAGETPWRFAFDSQGRFQTAKRANPPSVGTGDATWTVVYDGISLNGAGMTGTGLPDLSLSASKEWGQTTAPTGAVAVFAPDKAPSTSTPADGDWSYGTISYFSDEGRTTNTATYGAGAWQVDSTMYDGQGNEVWSLNEGNRNLALASDGDSAAAANSLATTTIYNTDGTRVEEEYGPTRSVMLKNGDQVEARTKSVSIYDDEAAAESVPVPGRPTVDPDAPALNLVVESRDSVVDAAGNVFDTTKTRSSYDPVVSGDGDGWALGTPTRVSTQFGAGWSTTLTRFDTEGKTVETRTPQGVATTNGAGSDTRSTKTVYYTADASATDSACRNKPEWAGLECVTGPAGQPGTGANIPVSSSTGFDYLLNATKSTETSGTTVRTSTTIYDAAGRKTTEKTSVSGAPTGDQTVPDTTYTYSPTSGALTSTTADGSTMTTTYDAWGRPVSQTDGKGNTATTTFDTAGRVATSNDGKGTYTYTYDGTDVAGKAERRGLVTKLDVGLASGPDEYNIAHDADGNNNLVVYPNGIKATTTFDTAGVETALTYRKADDSELLAFSNVLDADSRVRLASSPGSTQAYTYDDRDRLAKVEDTTVNGCVTRQYSFSLDSDRESLATSGPDSAGACTTSGAITVSSSFDAADRITNTGYTYDNLGRTRTAPAIDTDQPSGGTLTAAYYANDMVASLTQTVPAESGTVEKIKAYSLDAGQRLSAISDKTAGVELRKTTNHYADSNDSPAWIDEQTRANGTSSWVSAWTRNVEGPDGDLGLIQSSDGSSKIQITNLHGDVVTTLDNSTTFSGLDTYAETTEYGALRDLATDLGQHYGWLGAKQRSTDSVGGLTLMGARLYNPTTGRFLSRDPVAGGNDNPYTYPVDPINMFDLNGLWGWGKSWLWTKRVVFGKKAMKWYRRGSYLPYAGSIFSGMQAVGYLSHGKKKKALRAVGGIAASYVGGKYVKAAFSHRVKSGHVGAKVHKYAKNYVGYVHGQAASGAANHNYRGKRNQVR